MTSGFALLRSRAIRFQLTALMDLLLIMVFAQYLEFQRLHLASQAETEQEISDARDSFDRERLRQVSESNQIRDQAILESREWRRQRDEALLIANEANLRRGLIEGLLRELLEVETDLWDPELSPPESADTLQEVEATARAIRNDNGANLLRFLAGYDELLKRAEVWTIHVSDRGDTELQVGGDTDNSRSFRLEAVTQADRTVEFVQQLRAAFTQMPQPKGLVVILVSYSPRAIAGNYQPVLDGMPQAIDSLERDTDGLSQFQYAVIGAITDPDRDLPAELPKP